MFKQINERLQQASGQKKSFGNYGMTLTGDFAQLPAVGDRALYLKPCKNSNPAWVRLTCRLVLNNISGYG